MDDGGEAPRVIRVGVRELRGNLTRYLREVRQGASVLVTSRDDIIAEIKAPPASLQARRKPGALRGQIRIADDFNSTPEEILAAMER